MNKVEMTEAIILAKKEQSLTWEKNGNRLRHFSSLADIRLFRHE